MQFRTSFILLILMDLFFYASALLSVSFIFDHVQNIGPWNKNQLMFFISFMLGIDQLHMTFISRSFWEFSFNLKSGNLDFGFLKPVHSIFEIFFRYARPSSFLNIIVVWTLIIYYGQRVNLSWIDWALLPFLMLSSLALMVVLEIILSASMFWMTEGIGINFLRMQFQSLQRWPDFVYAYFSRKILTFGIPILIVGSGPIHFLFDSSNWHLLALLFVFFIVFCIVLKFVWRKGLERYESASS
jgi:ABC-2 type transport system permease protein